ncbi:MAG TPA: hypothetical protein VFQ67_13375 [Allosphingosinicella sp.]|jgi:hypothetical protein|nr:hypothetical protein [Allosphingosinicella sp.]
MTRSAPLRFLAIVLGGWAALRTALVAPLWPTPPAGAAVEAAPLRNAAATAVRQVRAPPAARAAARAPVERKRTFAETRLAALPALAASPSPPKSRALPPPAAPPAAPAAIGRAAASPPARPLPAEPAEPALRAARAGRWSLSAWAFVRSGGPVPLAAGGLLGGSQAGARLAFRLNRDRGRPLALSARLSGPARRQAGAEAALGIDWRPARRFPAHVLAERRQALGRDGRSAFALTVYGGASDTRIGRFRLDAYAQAGLVGAGSPDPFGDGSARLSLPLNARLRLGAGAWAAAQPGLSRLDLGPHAALRLPVAGRVVTLAADWRLRVAGNARPGSGPALTLASDF